MAIRTIRSVEDEILRKKSRNVKEITSNIIQLLEDMKDTMINENGVGLAAVQVGVLKRIIIIDIGEGLIELINPEIIKYEGEQIKYEGCLSIKGERGRVKRPEYVKVKGKNRNFEDIIIEGRELLAIALSHEIDHLDGILYIDKLEPEEEEEDDDEYCYDEN